jgi:AcrR family transcriptional regulator
VTATAVASGKRAQLKAENRATILDAAREVLAELGYDAAGVSDVIRRTELASGTFYNYFPDKEFLAEDRLLLELLSGGIARIGSA